ncbi:MAG TPA: disulfide bond formation protein B [Burkholderiaceae bacterium]|nr:disulfide bond formation protein B [Burkholderiaceae bacterium]
MNLIELIDRRPRLVLAAVAALCVGLLSFGMFLQHVVGLEPCPMCIVQRYAMVLVALAALLGASWPSVRTGAGVAASAVVLLSGFGAFVAARQSFLQWFPPQEASCGRDFYGMIETFPLQRVVPMIFKGSGDCAAVDWSFLTLTIANWSFLNFCLIGLVAATVVWRSWVNRRQ